MLKLTMLLLMLTLFVQFYPTNFHRVNTMIEFVRWQLNVMREMSIFVRKENLFAMNNNRVKIEELFLVDNNHNYHD